MVIFASVLSDLQFSNAKPKDATFPKIPVCSPKPTCNTFLIVPSFLTRRKLHLSVSGSTLVSSWREGFGSICIASVSFCISCANHSVCSEPSALVYPTDHSVLFRIARANHFVCSKCSCMPNQLFSFVPYRSCKSFESFFIALVFSVNRSKRVL